MSKKLLLSFLVISFAIISNSGNAIAAENDINPDVLGYSYVNNTVLGEQHNIYDVNNINQYAYSSTKTGKDISDYVSMNKRERQMAKMQNKYAALDNDLAFEPTNYTMEDTNFWIRPYGSIEDVKTGSGKLQTRTYGTYLGVNSGLIELGHGWDAVLGGYAGYTGAYIYKDDVKTYQNGGTLGFESMFIRNNFFTGLTINSGAMTGEIKPFDITSTFFNIGASNKTGYNWELADGKFIIQPNLVTSYIFAHTVGHTKHYGNGESISIDNDSLNTVLIEPGLNFIGKFRNGWEPYAGVSIVCNIAHSNHIQGGYASMPDISSRTFIKYGAGLRKVWNDRFGANFQTFARSGGRAGVGFQGGFNVALGK